MRQLQEVQRMREGPTRREALERLKSSVSQAANCVMLLSSAGIVSAPIVRLVALPHRNSKIKT